MDVEFCKNLAEFCILSPYPFSDKFHLHEITETLTARDWIISRRTGLQNTLYLKVTFERPDGLMRTTLVFTEQFVVPVTMLFEHRLSVDQKFSIDDVLTLISLQE